MATAEPLDPGAMASRSEDSDNFGNGSGDMTDSSTPSSTPPSLTHDTSRARFHMKDLSCFATCLENSAKRAFPTRGRSCSRYKSVQVLLLMWEDDELGIDNELDGLHQIFSSYGFDTETWLIPSDNPHLELTIKAANFVKKYESEDCLLIVYYGGHAAINSARQSSWYCKSDPEFASISLEWSAIQTVFEKAISDVVLLLDCCGAASAAPIAGRAITETIAACGWEAIAPIPGRWSFTGALIEVLDEWIDHSFSVAMLHSQVLSVLKHPQPERRGNKKRKVECRRTPVYIHTSAEPGIPSINLSRLLVKELPENNPITGVQIAFNEQVSVQTDNPRSIPVTYTLDDLTSSEPTGELKVPHVLISLALCEDQELELKACSEWLTAFPALAKYATVKGVYRSHSTLIIASVPVLIWDLLPENRACSFIGYVTSDNLLDLKEISNGANTAAHSQNVNANENNEERNLVTSTTPSVSISNLSSPASSPGQEIPISEKLGKEPPDVVEIEHSHSKIASILPTWWGHGFSEALSAPLDLPTDEIKSRADMGTQSHPDRLSNEKSLLNLVGAGGADENLPTTCINCFTQTTPLWHHNLEGQSFCDACGQYLMRHGVLRPLPSESYGTKEQKEERDEARTGVDPERRKQLSGKELPNFKDQADAAQLRSKNLEIEEWRSDAGHSADTDDDFPIQTDSAPNAPTSKTRRRARNTSKILYPGSFPPVVLQEGSRIAQDAMEENFLDPVSDSESIRENQLEDNQIYFNPRATEINVGDLVTMQRSRHWIDGPDYPYLTNTNIQAPTAVEAEKRWNDAAETFAVLSRTATWGTRRRSEPDIDDIGCDNGGSFLKLSSLRIHESEPFSSGVSLLEKIGKILRGKTDKNPKRIRDPDPSVDGKNGPPVSLFGNIPEFKLGARIRRKRAESNLGRDSTKDGIYGMWKKMGGPPITALGVTPFDSDPSIQTVNQSAQMNNAWPEPEPVKSGSSRKSSHFTTSTPPHSSEFSEDWRLSTVPIDYSRTDHCRSEDEDMTT